MIPKRVQRERKKGYRHPPNTRYCGRGTKYGNPFEMGLHEYGGVTKIWTRQEVVALFRQEIDVIAANCGMTLREYLAPLYEYEFLSCFCPPGKDCHVDVIIEKMVQLETYMQYPLLSVSER